MVKWILFHQKKGKAILEMGRPNNELYGKLISAIKNDYGFSKEFFELEEDNKKLIMQTAKYFLVGETDNLAPNNQKFKNTFNNTEIFWDITSRRYVLEAPAKTNFRILVGADDFNIETLNKTLLMR